jgi:hypothetical protein
VVRWSMYYTDDEQALVDYLATSYGRALTPAEALVSIYQARGVGYLPQDDGYDMRVMAPSWPRR